MRRFAGLLAAAAAGLVVGCLSGPPPADEPARIIDPTSASRVELQRVVSEALRVESVILADDALTDTSVLVIERNRVRRLGDSALSGRDLGLPHRFHLVKQGKRCVLVHDESGRRFDLAETSCVAP